MGQILINKKRHLDALILVEHMLKTPSFWFNFSDVRPCSRCSSS